MNVGGAQPSNAVRHFSNNHHSLSKKRWGFTAFPE